MLNKLNPTITFCLVLLLKFPCKLW